MKCVCGINLSKRVKPPQFRRNSLSFQGLIYSGSKIRKEKATEGKETHKESEEHASLLFTNFNLPVFSSLDMVASQAISFEQMIVISTPTMAQIHLMPAFQGLCHLLEIINRGKISFFTPQVGKEERNRRLM